MAVAKKDQRKDFGGHLSTRHIAKMVWACHGVMRKDNERYSFAFVIQRKCCGENSLFDIHMYLLCVQKDAQISFSIYHIPEHT